MEGKSMTLSGKYVVLFCSVPASDFLEGRFELTRRPSRALNSPRVLLSELQRNKDTGVLHCAAEIPEYRQKQLMLTLIVCF